MEANARVKKGLGQHHKSGAMALLADAARHGLDLEALMAAGQSGLDVNECVCAAGCVRTSCF